MEHRIVDLPALVVGGYAKTFTPETMPEIAQLWETHSGRLAELAPKTNKVCYGLAYDHKGQSEDGGPSMHYLIAVDVSADAPLPPDTTRIEVPASRYAVWTFNGHIAKFGEFVGSVWNDFMPRAGLTRAGGGFDFERYDERWKLETGPLDYYVAVELLDLD